tara:strand:- start:978 stop:1493 length:516 start_codon:yes stop_codon:yes gene_type:complete
MSLILTSLLFGALQYTPQQEALLDALIQVESNGNDEAVGDNGNAIGCLQIWKIYWTDATEFSGIGGSYKDCYKREYAKKIVNAYMKRYAKEAWTNPTKFNAEKCARIHNGGPRGYKKKATLKYWEKVKRVLSSPNRIKNFSLTIHKQCDKLAFHNHALYGHNSITKLQSCV